MVLVGVVDGVAATHARIQTVLDKDAWWLAQCRTGKMVVKRDRQEFLLRVVVPENVRQLKAGDLVMTATDRLGDRVVPDGLVIGTLAPDLNTVVPALEPRSLLDVRILRQGKLLPLIRPEPASDGGGAWHPVRVVQSRDSNRRRDSMVLVREGTTILEVDAPVANGIYLEGWIHTAAGPNARVRLIGDPGFYVHVLVLRRRGAGLICLGGGVFRGRRREAQRLDGFLRLGSNSASVLEGDLVVVGPHQGTGGIGYLIGEVVSCGEGGAVVLSRRSGPGRGDRLWVGTFTRPPAGFAVRKEEAR